MTLGNVYYISQSSVSMLALGRDMRLIFVLLVFSPALIYGRLVKEDHTHTIPTNDISEDSEDQEKEKIIDLPDPSEAEEGRLTDEDEPSNSNEDKAKTTDLSDSSKPREGNFFRDFLWGQEGKEKEINEDEEDCDGAVKSTQKQCPGRSKCNICWYKSKDTGKKISFACYFPVPNNHTKDNIY